MQNEWLFPYRNITFDQKQMTIEPKHTRNSQICTIQLLDSVVCLEQFAYSSNK